MRWRVAPTALLLGVILLAALALRLQRIDQPFVDRDGWRQSSTAMMAENIYRHWNPLYPEINWDGPGPSYNGREFQLVTSLAAMGYAVFGQVDWVGRMVSVSFGLLGIFAFFKLANLIWDRDRAIVGAAVLAVLPGDVFVDRQFLPDPAMVALVTTGCWMWFTHLQTGSRSALIWAATATTLGFLTKLNGACVGLAMALAGWTALKADAGRRLNRRAIILAAIATLVTVDLYYAWAWHISRTYPPHHFAGARDFVWNNSFAEWWGSGYFVRDLLWQLRGIWTEPGLWLVAAGLLLKPPARDHDTSSRWFFHWWLLIAGGAYYLVGAAHLTRQPYNLHLFNPPAAALTAHVIVTVGALVGRWAGRFTAHTIAGAAVCGLAVIGLRNVDPYSPDSIESYRLGLTIRATTAADDLVVTFPDYLGDPASLYYGRRHGWVFPPAAAWPSITNDWDQAVLTPEAVGWLDDLRARGAKWIAFVKPQHDRIWRDNPQLGEYVERAFVLQRDTGTHFLYRARD